MDAFWVGLVQLGLGRGPVERKMGPWVLRRAQSFRNAKPKLQLRKGLISLVPLTSLGLPQLQNL